MHSLYIYLFDNLPVETPSHLSGERGRAGDLPAPSSATPRPRVPGGCDGSRPIYPSPDAAAHAAVVGRGGLRVVAPVIAGHERPPQPFRVRRWVKMHSGTGRVDIRLSHDSPIFPGRRGSNVDSPVIPSPSGVGGFEISTLLGLFDLCLHLTSAPYVCTSCLRLTSVPCGCTSRLYLTSVSYACTSNGITGADRFMSIWLCSLTDYSLYGRLSNHQLGLSRGK